VTGQAPAAAAGAGAGAPPAPAAPAAAAAAAVAPSPSASAAWLTSQGQLHKWRLRLAAGAPVLLVDLASGVIMGRAVAVDAPLSDDARAASGAGHAPGPLTAGGWPPKGRYMLALRVTEVRREGRRRR
jgi:hypothetical protein